MSRKEDFVMSRKFVMSTFSTVYLFQGQNASVLTAYTGILCFIFLFNLFIYLLLIFCLFCFVFHVYLFRSCLLFIHRLGTLSAFSTFSRLEYFVFLYHGQERNVFLSSFFHACLLISWTGILSIFFTLRIFVLLQHMQDFLFLFVYLFHAYLLFHAN